jgi:hypothetical protein
LLNHEVRTSVHGCIMALDSVRQDLHTQTTTMVADQWKHPPSWTLLEDTIGKLSTLLTEMVDLRNLQEGNLSCPNAHFSTGTVIERLLQPCPLHRTSKLQHLLVAKQPDLLLLAFHLEREQRAYEHTSRSSTASISSPLTSTRLDSGPSTPGLPREWSGSDLGASSLKPAITLSRPQASHYGKRSPYLTDVPFEKHAVCLP